MKFRIVSDSSSNVNSVSGVDYAAVPLKLYLGTKEYVDNPDLDVTKMMDDFSDSKEKTSTSCPNIYDWLTAFEGADEIFAITISGKLSGTYGAAVNAKEEYISKNPGAKVCVIDSLSTGPEMHLIIDKIKELHDEGKNFDEIAEEVEKFRQNITLFFCLKSLENLARNGRINGAVAKIASVLGIQVIGKASEQGEIQMMHKCRGKNKTLRTILSEMEAGGFKNKKAIISHCNNFEDANLLKEKIKEKFAGAEVLIEKCGGLCSYYAERGGFIIGFVCG